MRHLIALVPAAAFALLIGGSSPAAQPATPRAAAIDAVLQQAVARRDVPGVVAIATDRRGVIYSGAAGVASGRPARPMTTDAIFRIASMTKAVTSVALMQLVDEKKVGLDDPVSKYFPAFAKLSVITSFDQATGAYTVRPASRPVTVRHLLTHTSGLGYGFTSPIVRDFKPRNGDTFEVGPLLFDPGADWIYGTSTDWVGRIVESVSGKDLDTYFRERIFGPLGMRDSHFNVPETALPRLVPVWRRQADGSLIEPPAAPPQRVTRFNGGGGLSSTAGDYIKFLQMLLNEGQLNGTRILSAASVKLMSVNQMGAVSAHATRTAQADLSADFSFINEGKDKWGLGFLITNEATPGLRSARSLSWGGLNNTYFWLDPARGVAGVILMQFLPFADPRALAVYGDFERAVYQTQSSSQKPGLKGPAYEGWTPPRTPDGRPDLQGVWNYAAGTPLERPSAYAGREFLTDDELARAERELRERANADRRDGAGTDADLGRESNEFWFARRKTILTRRTSLIIDPPDGKLPAVTAEAERRRTANADYLREHPADWEDRRLNERCIMFLQSGPPIIPISGPGGELLIGFPFHFEIFQTRDYVVIHHEELNRRIIPLDGRLEYSGHDSPVAGRLPRPLGGRYVSDRDDQFSQGAALRGGRHHSSDASRRTPDSSRCGHY